MRRSRTVGGSARAAWVTRAEAAFLARVPLEEIDRRSASGRLTTCRVGASVFVDPAGLQAPAPSEPVEARSVRRARGRSDRALPALPSEHERPVSARMQPMPRRRSKPRPVSILGVLAGVTALTLLVVQLALFGTTHPTASVDLALPTLAPATSAPAATRVGRDPFASPFVPPSGHGEAADVVVKPPAVVRDGDAVAAAATVVNHDPDRWLPAGELTFIARDDTGSVIARAATTVSLGPGGAKTAVVPDLGVDPARIASIEAQIDPAPLRSRGYRAPGVRVTGAAVAEGGKAIEGFLEVRRGVGPAVEVSCAVFGALDELAAVSSASVDVTRARDGRVRFWLRVEPATPGPYDASCSAS